MLGIFLIVVLLTVNESYRADAYLCHIKLKTGLSFRGSARCSRPMIVNNMALPMATNAENEREDENDYKRKQQKIKIILKEIEGEGTNLKTGQFIVSKQDNSGSDIPLFAFSTPTGPITDNLIVVGSTVGGLFLVMLAFILSNKDIVPFVPH
jgi:hypothetical protein